METKKFWCHYIGSDGNTPKRRNMELTNLCEVLPIIDNEHAKTPIWFEREEQSYGRMYYHLYAQLSDNVAVYIMQVGLSDIDIKILSETDADIEARCNKSLERFMTDFPKASEERKAQEREYWPKRIEDDKKSRDYGIERLKALLDYGDYLLNGKAWISAATLRAFEEVKSPIYLVLEHLRKLGLEKREEEHKRRQEEHKQHMAEEARKKAEAEAKEQERLNQEAENFRHGEKISGEDVVTLCRRYGIAIHLRTVHNLQQVIHEINGKGNCTYYKQRGKRSPILDGCYITAHKLYDYLQNH